MSKKIFTKLLTSICLMGPISTTIQITPQVVQAASNKVQVKGSKRSAFIIQKVKRPNIMLIQVKDMLILLKRN